MTTSFHIGKHFIAIGDDYYTLTANGDISEEEATKINEVQVKYFPNKSFFSMCDLTNMGKVSPAARKAFAGSSSSANTIAVALWGASFQTRILSNLLMNAINLVQKQSLRYTFFKTESEAKVWVDELRNSAKQATLK